eukprot:scaffold1368_cov333-Pavlova_lutheri.AAC.11
MATFAERGVAARNILFRPYVMVPGTGNAVASGVGYGRDACIAVDRSWRVRLLERHAFHELEAGRIEGLGDEQYARTRPERLQLPGHGVQEPPSETRREAVHHVHAVQRLVEQVPVHELHLGRVEGPRSFGFHPVAFLVGSLSQGLDRAFRLGLVGGQGLHGDLVQRLEAFHASAGFERMREGCCQDRLSGSRSEVEEGLLGRRLHARQCVCHGLESDLAVEPVVALLRPSRRHGFSFGHDQRLIAIDASNRSVGGAR